MNLEIDFPNLLGKNYNIIKGDNYEKFNCHAFSLEIYDYWCGSSEKSWPVSIKRIPSVENYIKYFNTFRYYVCNDDSFDIKYNKVAIYVSDGYVTHSCRQFRNMWRSKLGYGDILEHELEWIEGEIYGQVKVILQRIIEY